MKNLDPNIVQPKPPLHRHPDLLAAEFQALQRTH
jgi:hypothetical protein